MADIAETPKFNAAPLGQALLKLLAAMDTLVTSLNTNFTSQVAVVGSIGAPTFPTAATIAAAAATTKTAIANVVAEINSID